VEKLLGINQEYLWKTKSSRKKKVKRNKDPRITFVPKYNEVNIWLRVWIWV